MQQTIIHVKDGRSQIIYGKYRDFLALGSHYATANAFCEQRSCCSTVALLRIAVTLLHLYGSTSEE
jgi:hypothetical protein